MRDPYEIAPSPSIPRAFWERRFQSITGFLLFLFLCEHLFTNSQAAFFWGDEGRGFIAAANFLHALPYRPAIEIALLAVPIGVHVWWGVQYVQKAKYNSQRSDGTTPSLPLSRNVGFTWQRITALLLIVGIALHVIYMRFIKQPEAIERKNAVEYVAGVTYDPALTTVAPKVDVKVYDAKEASELAATSANARWLEAIRERTQKVDERAVVASSFGAAFLMVLRDTFRSPILCCLYSLFVIVAAFHACNGLWTFTISWGVALTERARYGFRLLSNAFMYLLVFLGLASIWGAYWITV